MSRTHVLNAKVLAVFLLFHMGNHAAVLMGRESHLAVMEALRVVYRHPLIEYPLFLLFGLQVILGLGLVFKRGRPKGLWAWAQVVSGMYIAVFLLQHLGAVVATRMGQPFETTTYWAASVVSAQPLVWYFFPYYVLGIWAMFLHVAAALRFRTWPSPATPVHKGIVVFGFVFAVAVVWSLSAGAMADLPEANHRYIEGLRALLPI